MQSDRDLLRQALGYMESVGQMDMHPEEWAIAVALREQLAQPEQEPVAWISKHGVVYPLDAKDEVHPINDIQPLYTTPPRREWVGLTEKDFSAINQSCLTNLQAATSAESILKEKNA